MESPSANQGPPGGSPAAAGEARSPRILRHAKIDLDRRPFIVIWEATRACDLACAHCRASAIAEPPPGELDGTQARRLIDQIAAVGKPPPLFVITGGDPFKRPDLFELVSYASGKRLPVAVSPSGTPNLNAANLRRLRDAGARVISLSIDGADARTHDSFRGIPGVFDLTLAGWESARAAGLKVQINTTVSPLNVHQLPDILDLVVSRGVLTWSVFFLVPTGRGSRLAELSPAETEDVLNFLHDADRIVSLKTTEAPHFRRVCIQRQILAEEGLDHVSALGLGPLYRQLTGRLTELSFDSAQEPKDRFDPAARLRRPPLEINAGKGFVFISNVGDVYPSGFLPEAAGNVRTTPLAEIYRGSEIFTGVRDGARLTGRCGHCEFRGVCGGSRSRAYAVTGDLFGQEPSCGYQPGSFGRADHVADLAGAG